MSGRVTDIAEGAEIDPERTCGTLMMASIWSTSMDQQATDTAVKRAREVMDGFAAAFNAEDADAMRSRWFNFPHVRFHSGRVTIMERPEDFSSTVWERAGEAKEWARTTWDYVEVVDAGPDKVHFRVQFTRYRADGSSIGSYKSFYIVTFQNGRWGIQGRSSWADAG